MDEPDDKTEKYVPAHHRDHSTTGTFTLLAGNSLFEAAVEAIGLDDGTVRWVFVSILDMLGVSPGELTPDELGGALPELSRRLRLLVQPAQADEALGRVQRLLIRWEEPR